MTTEKRKDRTRSEDALYRAAIDGNVNAAFTLGKRLLDEGIESDSHLKGIELLKLAYRSGSREAGWEIVLLGSDLRDLAQLSDPEQISLLTEAGLNGDPHAALTGPTLPRPGRKGASCDLTPIGPTPGPPPPCGMQNVLCRFK